jgi:hypothetical protein
VAGGPRGGGPAAAAPLIRRGAELRGELILRVFAVERFFRFLIMGGAAYGAWRFTSDRAAALHGGTCQAGPRPGGGFAVRVAFPVDAVGGAGTVASGMAPVSPGQTAAVRKRT